MLTRKDLIAKFSNKTWISPYERIVAMVDKEAGLLEVHEFHARGKCIGGSAWEIYHYPRVSRLVTSAKREGARNIFLVKLGECELDLIPGIAGAGIERATLSGDEIRITYAGLAGGGIAATVCRGMAENVKRIEIHERGGGSQLGRSTLVLPIKKKLIIGVDDTDEPGDGATWGLVNEMAHTIDKEGLASYLGHVIVQLYTKNPNKTTNCVSIAATFAVDPQDENRLVETFRDRLEKSTYSKHTGMAVYRGIIPPELVKNFSIRAKKEFLYLKEAEEVAATSKVDLIPITGQRGLIGALAAIGFANEPDEAVRVYA